MGSEMCIRDSRSDMQREFVYFANLYAPTVATSSVRILASFANEYDLELCHSELCHFDVDQAFVLAHLKEDVFMRLPEGCGALSEKMVKLN